jgi:hypothetical protein
MKCGRVFLDAEFNHLETRKTKLLQKKMEARVYLINLAWELLTLQKEHHL